MRDGQRLQAQVVSATEVSAQLSEGLYRLYERFYDGTDPARFWKDLQQKQWVILLHEQETCRVVGFSTQALMTIELEGRPVSALFSGDTIIHPDYWGSQELVRAWCRLAGRLKARCGDQALYWFLISKGHRTYLYLPCFFREFYPRYDCPTPSFEQRLIQALGAAQYPREFNPAAGLIEHRGAHDHLKAGLDAAARRRHNPHVAFFLRHNPRYQEGVELACVAEIAPENMRSFARRELEAGLKEFEPGAGID